METQVASGLAKISTAVPIMDVRTCRRIEIGHAIHQGDIYVHRVADDHQRGEVIGERKLAIGQGDGSNHRAEGDVTIYRGVNLPPWVEAPEWADAAQMLGPVVVACAEWMVTHPKHAHHVLPAGTYQVTYQIDRKTMLRVED